jgi:Flp pilus assembly protein TadD
MRWRAGLRGLGIVVVVVAATAALFTGVARWRMEEGLARGVTLVADREYLLAVPVLLAVITVAPHDPRPHYYLALAYCGVGIREGAEAQLREAVALDGAGQTPSRARVPWLATPLDPNDCQ